MQLLAKLKKILHTLFRTTLATLGKHIAIKYGYISDCIPKNVPADLNTSGIHVTWFLS